MEIKHNMPEKYLNHDVFSEIDFMINFYDSLSFSSLNFMPSGVDCNINYASYVYSAIEGTLESIHMLLKNGRINDAYSLIRKLFDDILLEIYINVMLKDKFDFYNNIIVRDVVEWIKGRHRIPKTEKILKYIEKSKQTKDLYPLFGWETYLKKIRELLDDSVHSNRFQLMLLNCNRVYMEEREQHLDNCKIVLKQLFLVHVTFLFHLNPQYLMASDYTDSLELGMIPQEDSQNWIAPFAQVAFNRVIKPHSRILDFILKTCSLKIE
ncbi:MAG: hypothetical protein NC115_09950 [Bacteroidales bacterium]|nr:hypothetical protein [Bacteroidales bacterium]